MERDQATGAHRMQFGKHDQYRGEFIHVTYALHAVPLEKRGIGGIVTCHRPGM